MDYHWDSTAQNSVRPKLCTMAHAVMLTVSCNGNTSSEGLQLFKHLTLVFLPIKIDQWEKLGLKKKTYQTAKSKLCCIEFLYSFVMCSSAPFKKRKTQFTPLATPYHVVILHFSEPLKD